MAGDICVGLSRGARGLSVVSVVLFPDHTHLLFYIYTQTILECEVKKGNN